MFLDEMWLKRSWGGEARTVSLLMAIGVAVEGYRAVLGVCEGDKEDAEIWRSFVRWLRERGLSGVRLLVSDKCLGCWRRSQRPIPTPSGRGGYCTSTVTSSRPCRRGSSPGGQR